MMEYLETSLRLNENGEDGTLNEPIKDVATHIRVEVNRKEGSHRNLREGYHNKLTVGWYNSKDHQHLGEDAQNVNSYQSEVEMCDIFHNLKKRQAVNFSLINKEGEKYGTEYIWEDSSSYVAKGYVTGENFKSSMSKNKFVLDSRSSWHLHFRKEDFATFTLEKTICKIGNGQTSMALGLGNTVSYQNTKRVLDGASFTPVFKNETITVYRDRVIALQGGKKDNIIY
eukprot:Ihof_evm19s43 gene=Ihof_evmTU19s43